MQAAERTEDDMETTNTPRKLDRRNIDMEKVKYYLDLAKKARKPLKFALKIDIIPYLDDLYEAVKNSKEVELEHYQQFLDDPEAVPGYALCALGIALVLESVVIHGGNNE